MNKLETFDYSKLCGIENIHLVNGWNVHFTPYGKGVSISDIDGLQVEIEKSTKKRLKDDILYFKYHEVKGWKKVFDPFQE